MKIKTLTPIYGGNRMNAANVGEAFKGCSWVGIPFMGALSELPYIDCRTGTANDLHRHAVNLANVLSDGFMGSRLIRELRRIEFHPAMLSSAQAYCLSAERNPPVHVMGEWARAYFICCWLSRSNSAGTKGEFKGKLCTRWGASGGDSVTRFRGAVEGLREWRLILSKWQFSCMDAFDFLAKCKDEKGHGIYADPPFYGPGKLYRHNCGDTDDEQIAWHNRLATALHRFENARVILRAYDVPRIRELYPENKWEWRCFQGRTQANKEAAEVLIVRN